MKSCPKCGTEVAQGATVCENCKAVVGVPKRPLGVAVIAWLMLVGGVLNVYFMLTNQHIYPVYLGMAVSPALMRIIQLILAVIGIYCAIGLLQLKGNARKLYIGLSLFYAIETLVSFQMRIAATGLLQGPGAHSRLIAGIIGTIIGLAIQGWMLFYVVRRKQFFIN